MTDERVNIDDKAFRHGESGTQHGAKMRCLAADAFDIGKGNVREGVYPVQVGLTQLGKAGKSSQFNAQMHSALRGWLEGRLVSFVHALISPIPALVEPSFDLMWECEHGRRGDQCKQSRKGKTGNDSL